MAFSIEECSVTVRDDGTVFYQATVGSAYDDPQRQASVEWYIGGRLAARDGPLSVVNEGNFEQPREGAFTENELLNFATEQDVIDAFGTGTHNARAELILF